MVGAQRLHHHYPRNGRQAGRGLAVRHARPDGVDHQNRIEFLEIVKPERLANQMLGRLAEHLTNMALEKDLVFTRIFDAPRDLVFKAWTDAEHLKRWWGPHGFTNPVCEVDPRPGGAIRIDMRGPDGAIYPMTGLYREIVEPERLVITCIALDENGDPLFEELNTVTFADHAGKTKLTVHAKILKARAEAAPYLAGMEQGWSQSLERLAGSFLSGTTL